MYGNIQGIDIGYVLNVNTPKSSDPAGIAVGMGMVLEICEWIWNSFWEWIPGGDGSTMAQIINAVVSHFVQAFNKETGLPIPHGIPGSSSTLSFDDVYVTYLTSASDPEVTNRTWANSRGGLATVLDTKGLFRILEGQGKIKRDTYRRPGYSLNRLVIESSENMEEVESRIYGIATASEPSLRGGCVVTYETVESVKIVFANNETGALTAPLFDWGCRAGVTDQDGCHENPPRQSITETVAAFF
jgi:hypothetical protein